MSRGPSHEPQSACRAGNLHQVSPRKRLYSKPANHSAPLSPIRQTLLAAPVQLIPPSFPPPPPTHIIPPSVRIPEAAPLQLVRGAAGPGWRPAPWTLPRSHAADRRQDGGAGRRGQPGGTLARHGSREVSRLGGVSHKCGGSRWQLREALLLASAAGRWVLGWRGVHTRP